MAIQTNIEAKYGNCLLYTSCTRKPPVSAACSVKRLTRNTSTAARSTAPRLLSIFFFMCPPRKPWSGGLRSPRKIIRPGAFYYSARAVRKAIRKGLKFFQTICDKSL